MTRSVLLFLLALCAPPKSFATEGGDLQIPYYSDASDVFGEYESESYSGWYNNRANPSQGGVETPLLRYLPTAYEDGVGRPSGSNRPSPLDISDAVMKDPRNVTLPSHRNRTVLSVFFGQHVVDEILDTRRAGCLPEFFNLSVPAGHALNPLKDGSSSFCPLRRSRYDEGHRGMTNGPRRQLNAATPYIDGSAIYGTSKAWTDSLRQFTAGHLKSTLTSPSYSAKDFPGKSQDDSFMTNLPPPRDHYVKPPQRLYQLGNSRGNENPLLLALGVLWYRFHNVMADSVSRQMAAAAGVANSERFRIDNDEKIFNEARKWVIATQQKIIFYDWLPQWLATYLNGSTYQLPLYTGYKPFIETQISDIFQVAMKYGETLVPSAIFRRLPTKQQGYQCQYVNNSIATGAASAGKRALRLCNTYWNADEATNEHGVEAVLLGMMSQVAEREDTHITSDLREFAYGDLEFSRRDLAAIAIQRGRDHGLPDYNTARTTLGLTPARSWTEINPELCRDESSVGSAPECFFARGLKSVYGDRLDDLDIWPAGLAETTADGPGPLFRTAMASQFTAMRDGDRFWFENAENGLFDEEQRQRIRATTLRDVILSVTDISPEDVNDNVFFFLNGYRKCQMLKAAMANRESVDTSAIDCLNFTCSSLLSDIAIASGLTLAAVGDLVRKYSSGCANSTMLTADPCEVPLPYASLSDSSLERCTPLETFDYFTGSAVSYVVSFVVLALIVLVIAGVLLLAAHMTKRKWNADQQKIRKLSTKPYKMDEDQCQIISEWLGFEEGERNVRLKMNAYTGAVDIYEVGSSRRQPARTVVIKGTKQITLKEAVEKTPLFVVMSIPTDCDVVLRFDAPSVKESFIKDIKALAATADVTVAVLSLPLKHLLRQAVTKAKRQPILEKFFRAVFTQAFHEDAKRAEKKRKGKAVKQHTSIIECKLNEFEFAEALDIKPDSLFAKNMFALMDKDNTGLISFRNFLDVLIIFAKGSADDKMRLLFDMYDVEGDGNLTILQFKQMLRSLMDLSNTQVDQSHVDQVIESMLVGANLSGQLALTFANFQTLLHEYKNELQYAQLGFEGYTASGPHLLPLSRQITAFGCDRKDSAVARPDRPLSDAEVADRQVTAAGKTASLPHKRGATLTRGAGASGWSKESKQTRAQRTIVTALNTMQGSELRRKVSAIPVTTVPSRHVSEETSGPVMKYWMYLVNWMENHRRHVFWVSAYTLVCLGIFAYKVYSYAVAAEHLGVRGVTGYGVAVTRGSASGLMFTYSTLLVAMCRNIMTLLRETFVNQFLPIDSYISFHKLIAVYSLVFSMLHIVGHAFNFYHLTTQNPSDVYCVFPEFVQSSTALPKLHYWLWSSITGVTGVFLTVLMAVIYIFATQYSRRHIFRAFRITHSLYVVFFVLMALHGTGMLLQEPIFYYFLLGPAVLYTLDKLISVSRTNTEIAVFKAELLPSGVTALTFRKPVNFQYRSGQWVRVACLPLGESEYHPFTLTSAPHEEFLSVHVRAVGPWTHNLRHTYDGDNLTGRPYPKLYLDGPYGEGHQDWYRFGVSVLIGGGIGVTPFASILKDVVHKSRIGMKINCKKVYFIWVTQSQKHFEWFVDIVREVEDADVNNMVSIHLFITQFYKKFDIRTTMLYICERHFQKISGRSLFTGLLSVTHFGRPDFETFLSTVRVEHGDVPKIGVFSCGPPSMTKFVMQACSRLNRIRHDEDDPVFFHHSENF